MTTDASTSPTASERLRFGVRGMTCASCVRRVEKALDGVEGVTRAAVNLATEQATVEAAGQIDLEILRAAVDRAGYDLLLPDADQDEDAARDEFDRERTSEERRLLVRSLFSLAVAALLMTWMLLRDGAVIGIHVGWAQDVPLRYVHPAMFVLTAPVQFWAGAMFYRGAFKAARHGTSDMNTLIALGTSAAFGYSVVATFAPRLLEGIDGAASHTWFEASAAIIGLVLLGRWLEARAKGRTSAAVRALIDLRPQLARVIEDDQEYEIPVRAVQAGDIVLVKPGEQIPVDGEVVEGASAVDESMLTGASVPTRRSRGSSGWWRRHRPRRHRSRGWRTASPRCSSRS